MHTRRCADDDDKTVHLHVHTDHKPQKRDKSNVFGRESAVSDERVSSPGKRQNVPMGPRGECVKEREKEREEERKIKREREINEKERERASEYGGDRGGVSRKRYSERGTENVRGRE